ncbi:MAG: chorismate mutase [Eubacteriales bacterium]|nr:chorismate mutase [Eubacteriales bacterium]
MELKDYRAAIDALDRELLALFAQRLSLCSEIAVWKKARGLPALDEAREKEKLAAVAAQSPAEYEAETAAFFERVIALCRASEERLLSEGGKES